MQSLKKKPWKFWYYVSQREEFDSEQTVLIKKINKIK